MIVKYTIKKKMITNTYGYIIPFAYYKNKKNAFFYLINQSKKLKFDLFNYFIIFNYFLSCRNIHLKRKK